MDKIKIQVQVRDKKGKEVAKKIRRQGLIPAVVYSEDTNIALTVPSESMKALRSIHFSESAVIDMEILGDKKPKTIPVFIKDIQFDPLSEGILHLDFLKVSLKEKIKVHVPIVVKGESKNVKEAGGVIEQILRDLEVEGLPLDIPDHIDLDISELEIGNSIHVADLDLGANIKIITDPEATVVTALVKKEEPEEEAEEIEGVEAEEGAEPEVIKEKKEEAEAGSEKEKPKKEEEKK